MIKTECRMDFKTESVEQIDEHTFRLKSVPDPERYELTERNGEKGYFDKLDKIFFPINQIEKIIDDMKNLPIHYSPPKIDDIVSYTKKRFEYLLSENEEETYYEFADTSEAFLKDINVDKMRFVIMSIDIKNSTKMSQELSDEDNCRVISLFLREIGLVISSFNGFVLKYLGDGIIAYFPEPNYIGMNDNAIDCANCIKYFILNGLNNYFAENKIPPIIFRIGLDSGEAKLMTVGSSEIKLHKDLIGQTINLATKIQNLAGTNQIFAGETTIKNAHYTYRQPFKKVNLPKEWDYKKKGTGKKYKVYANN